MSDKKWEHVSIQAPYVLEGCGVECQSCGEHVDTDGYLVSSDEYDSQWVYGEVMLPPGAHICKGR